MMEVVSAKKKALIAYKEKLLNDIKYNEKRIEQIRLSASQSQTYFEDDEDSSDSDSCLPQPLRAGPTFSELELQRACLSVCLQASQELTSLQVLQSEVNVLVDTPICDDKAELPVDGIWREVAAECRVDLVPFSMTFFVHQPSRKFSAPSYHNLRVGAVKAAHELELAQSVLADVRTPSDAVQMIRSYAVAHRSRRTTLARLAAKFPDSLFMESTATGGFLLKCADVLSVSWTLQNKWSPLAAFMHRMKFDLEYMDEAYLKEVKRAHSQLIDPSLETDERTHYLAKIIELCLEANRAPTESDTDTEGRARRTTLEAEPEMPQERKRSGDKPFEVPSKRSKDSEVMAPPKQLPKKVKPRGELGGNKGEMERNSQKGKETAVTGQKSEDTEVKGKANALKDSAVNGENNKENAERVKDNVKAKDHVQKSKESAVNEPNNKDNANAKKVKENATNTKSKDINDPKAKEKAGSGQNNAETGVTQPKIKANVNAKDHVQKSKESAVNEPKNKDNAKKVKENAAKVKNDDVNDPKAKEKAGSGENNTETGVTQPKNKANVKAKDHVQKSKESAVNEPNNKDNTKKVKENAAKAKKNDVHDPKAKEKAASGQNNAETGVSQPKNKANAQKPAKTTNNVQETKQTAVSSKKNNTDAAGEQSNKENIAKPKVVATKTDGKVGDAKKAAKRPLGSDTGMNKEENKTKGKEINAKLNSEAPSKKIKITDGKTDGIKKDQKSDKVEEKKSKDDIGKEQNENPKKGLDKIQVKEPKNIPNTKNKADTKKSEKVKETVHVEKMISGNTAPVTDRVEDIQTKPVAQARPVKNVQKTSEQGKPFKNKIPKDKMGNATKTNKITDAKIPVKSTKIPLKTAQNMPVPKLKKPMLPSGKKIPSENKILSPTSSLKSSKIPQKKLPTIFDKDRKRFDNPPRISPRKPLFAAKPGQPIAGGSKQLNGARNSPRLLTKSIAKPKSMFTF